MDRQAKPAVLSRAALEVLLARAEEDPRKLAAMANLAWSNGATARAYELARLARAAAPGDAEVHSLTDTAATAGAPRWHFAIVRDEVRNDAYEAALKRAVGPQTRVLDIGSGTGLLAMLAARAGAAAVTSCEMNPAVADAAREIVALNGYGDRVRVVAKSSLALDPDADMGGPADVLVSEIVSNNMLNQHVLPVMADAVARLLKPGGRMIPSSGRVRVALVDWAGLDKERMGEVAGFDMAPFNRLAHGLRKLQVGDPGIVLRSAPADLFDFDFTRPDPRLEDRAAVELVADGGRVNGVLQWLHLQLDEETAYENRPEPGATSCWAAVFHALERDIEPSPGETVRVCGAHDDRRVRIWIEPGR